MTSDMRFCCPPDSWLKRLDASSPRRISVRRSKIAGFVSGTPYRPAYSLTISLILSSD